MWDLNTIVRLNDEAQRRADAIREDGAREGQAKKARVPCHGCGTPEESAWANQRQRKNHA